VRRQHALPQVRRQRHGSGSSKARRNAAPHQSETHGKRGRRTWRKLHLAVDPASGEILASALTTTEEGDAALVGPLLEQVPGPIASVVADGAYDGEPVYRAVAERQPDPPAAVVIPPSARPPCFGTRPSSVVVFAPGLCLRRRPKPGSAARCSTG
jgi:hypothetical protein